MKELETATVLAIAKGIKPAVVKIASANLPTGQTDIDTTIRVKGYLRKAEDEMRLCHCQVPKWEVIAILLSKVNEATRQTVLKEVLAEALELEPEKVTAIKKEANKAIREIKDSFKQNHLGKVTSNLEFEVIADNSPTGTYEEEIEAVEIEQQSEDKPELTEVEVEALADAELADKYL